ncbi:MAG: choice-of-anchor D domain-containing protein, partial [Acidobacteria bacterium]|nr:choice-of-anchor D domain-containing protein [Acidobacteriota bacterium]
WQFDPPIAENGTFQADLKLEYDPGQFPDDPRFQESVLRIVSYDPGTGRLRSYPTTIDKQTHTATARVEGLDPYYSLAVIGPFNDAVLHAPTPDTAGVVFVNAGAQEANLRLNAYQATGQPVAGEEIENPASLRLAPGAQASSPSHAGLGKLAANAGGWIQSYSDRNTLAGTVLLARGKGFEALALDTALAASLILTGVESDSGTQAELHLTNASNFRNTVQLELRDTTGQLAGQAEIEMAPKARRESRVRNLFPQMTEPFRGRIHVQAEYRVWAALALAGADSLAAVNAQPLGPGEVTPSRLYSSHLAAGRLNIANPTAREARLSLRAFANDGSALGRAASITLRPGEQYWRDVAETFSLDAKAAVSGALVVESDAGGLAGDLSFGARAMLGLTGEAHRSVLLPHVANPAGAPMLVNIFNPSAATAAVDVRIYRADASLVGQTRVSIPPNGRISQALATLVTAAAGQVGGSIGIESDQPVVASAVLPSPDTSDVAALTAWPVLPTAKPAPVPTPAPAPTPTPAPAPPADVRIEVTPASLDFGSVQVGQTKDLSVTVRVLGNAPLTLTALSADNPRFTVLSPSAPLTVNFGATVSVQVRFAPDSAAALSATLTIRGNAPNQPVLTVRLSGTGFSTGSQELKLDDGVFEAALQPPEGASDLHMVNRLTPPAYPATLTQVTIYFHDREDGPAKGESVGILAGAATTGSDVDGTRLRATAARVGDVGRFVEYDVPPLTIESGDFVVGFNTRVERGSRPAAVDTSTQRLGLALISRDGRTFSPYGINGVFGFRAVVTVGR